MSTISGFNSLMAQAYNQPNQQIENAQRQAAINAAQVQAQREQAQIPLIQQQTQGAALENQLNQIKLNDTQNLSALYAKHADDDWNDPKTQQAFDADLAKSPVSWQARMDLQNQRLKWMQQHAALGKEQFDLEEKTNARAYEILTAQKDVPDADQAKAWQLAAPKLNNILGAQQFDPAKPLTGDALDFYRGLVGSHKGMLSEAKEKQDIAASRATQAETEAKTALTQTETETKQRQLAALKNPAIAQSLDDQIDSAIPVARGGIYETENNVAKRAVRGYLATGDPDALNKAQAAIKDSVDRVGRFDAAVQQAKTTSMPFREMALQQAEQRMNQQSFQANSAVLDRLQQPLTQNLSTIQRLQETLDQKNPAADATVASQLVRLVGGGEGSLAGTEAIADKALGGMTAWTALQEHLNKWSLDPNHGLLPDAYRKQVQKLIDTIGEDEGGRMDTLMQARVDLANASGPEQHRAIMSDTQNKVSQSYMAKRGAGATPVGGGQLARPKTRAERDALPKGTRYIDPEGNTATRQ